MTKTKKPQKNKNEQLFDKVWNEYNASLTSWNKATEMWQKAGMDAVKKYNETCTAALKTDPDAINKVYDLWQKNWQNIAPTQTKHVKAMWENIFNAEYFKTMKKLGDDFEKIWKVSPDEQFALYNKVLSNFNENWKKVIK